MGCRAYLTISLILLSSLIFSTGSAATAATGELPRQGEGERDSKAPVYRDPYIYPQCDNYYYYYYPQFCPPGRRDPQFSQPTTALTKP